MHTTIAHLCIISRQTAQLSESINYLVLATNSRVRMIELKDIVSNLLIEYDLDFRQNTRESSSSVRIRS